MVAMHFFLCKNTEAYTEGTTEGSTDGRLQQGQRHGGHIDTQ